MDALDLSIHAATHAYGVPELARKLGKREQVFRNKLNPNDETHGLMLHEFVAVLDVTGDLSPLETLVAMFGCTLTRKALPQSLSLMAAVLSADVEHGDVTRAIQSALADGRLTDRDRLTIRKEINEARAALDALEDVVLVCGREGV
jgi:hypothetical protein